MIVILTDDWGQINSWYRKHDKGPVKCFNFQKHQGDTSHDQSTQSYCHKATGEYAKLETSIFESGYSRWWSEDLTRRWKTEIAENLNFNMYLRYGRGLLAIKRVVHSKYKDINRKKCKWELSETHPDDAKNTCQDNHLSKYLMLNDLQSWGNFQKHRQRRHVKLAKRIPGHWENVPN